MQWRDELIELLTVSAEVAGTTLSRAAATLMVTDLLRFNPDEVRGALKKCRTELKTRLTLGEIVARLDDGRPTPDKAWAMLPWDDNKTAVVNDEIMSAMGLVADVYNSGDKFGARAAFKDAYTRNVADGRDTGTRLNWFISLGDDKNGRIAPINEAVRLGRIPAAHADRLLPAPNRMDYDSAQMGNQAERERMAKARAELKAIGVL